MPKHNDESYRMLFSSPELVRDLVLGFIPDDWLHSLDYSTLEKMPGSYVTDDHLANDVVWRVKVGADWVYLYILIEFQSEIDSWIAVRMMSYVGLLYQDLIKTKKVLSDSNHLPPVLPIVLYTGDMPWTAATNMVELMPKVPEYVSQFFPKMQYLLIAENQYANIKLAQMQNLAAAVMYLQRPQNRAVALDFLEKLETRLAGNP